MSGDTRISGRITITPPITKNELAGNRWAFKGFKEAFASAMGFGASDYPDVLVQLNGVDLTFADPSEPVGMAIVPTGFETSARTLLDDVDRIVQTFSSTPGGERRAFAGWLHVVWGGGEAVYRVHVVDGRAVGSKPVLAWPEGARDEDGAA